MLFSNIKYTTHSHTSFQIIIQQQEHKYSIKRLSNENVKNIAHINY